MLNTSIFEEIKADLSLLYNIFLLLFSGGIRFASLWNQKARLWLKGRREQEVPVYRQQTIWMHCSSLGEFEQGRPLAEALVKEFPTYPLVITFFSPSGYEIRKNYSLADKVLYLPIDGKENAADFIEAINPALVLWIKYEYWFHYLTTLKSRQIPVLLVSGIFRKGQPFFKWYSKPWLTMLSCFTQLFVQNRESLDLLKSIDFTDNVFVTGDTRFDRVTDVAASNIKNYQIEQFCNNHKTIVAGSIWEEDEDVLNHYSKIHPEIKFIIAPHEVDMENLNDVKKKFPGAMFYSKYNGEADVHIIIIDNIGMLSGLYKYATITYVGGGFRDSGIHNILEAAVYGKPVIFGPVYQKSDEARSLIEKGGAFSIQNALELEDLINSLFSNELLLRDAGRIAGEYVSSQRGATSSIVRYVAEKRLLTS